MKWICTALTVSFLAVTHVVAQDLFVTIPATPTKNPLGLLGAKNDFGI